DAVNVAARIEAACKDVGFDILVSESTAQAVAGCAVLDAGALALKGKSTRNRLFAVIGDGALAASAEFIELRRVHGQLVDALRLRSLDTRRILSVAKLKAAPVAPGLSEFYRRISRRADHFHDEPAAEGAAGE
ncbi:MAG TPA: adenylate/guanylate cyclase domain-containing protein, partial [Sinorhizobium sp.]|nr:adenylate/guanylate cyclase domain-containing protein [Sinorhizobium sp.]